MKRFLKWYLPVHLLFAILNIGIINFIQIEYYHFHGNPPLNRYQEIRKETISDKHILSFTFGPALTGMLFIVVPQDNNISRRISHGKLGIAWNENIIWPNYHTKIELNLDARPPA